MNSFCTFFMSCQLLNLSEICLWRPISEKPFRTFQHFWPPLNDAKHKEVRWKNFIHPDRKTVTINSTIMMKMVSDKAFKSQLFRMITQSLYQYCFFVDVYPYLSLHIFEYSVKSFDKFLFSHNFIFRCILSLYNKVLTLE